MPTFKDKSWDDYSFWQAVYYRMVSGVYREQLQNDIVARFKSAQGDLSRLDNVQQEDPLLSLIAEWNRTLRTYERDITCDEGSDVLQALTQLAEEAKAQWVRDELALKSGAKKLKQAKVKAIAQVPTTQTATSGTKPAKPTPKPEDDDDGLGLLVATFGGHAAATAKQRPAQVKPKAQPTKVPSKVESWQYKQDHMEDDCNDCIYFGEHDAAASVLYALGIHGQPGEQKRPSKCDNTNDETRIIFVGGRTFWTVGLSHKKRREANTYYAYERTGKKTFVHKAGKMLPSDSNAPA